MELIKKKLLLYTDKEGIEFAIMVKGEPDFKIMSNQSTVYTELIDEMKMKSTVFRDLTWIQILRLWMSFINNIGEEDYKLLKYYETLHFIDESEKVKIVTKKYLRTEPHLPTYDLIIVTDKRLIELKHRQSFLHFNWDPHFISFNDIKSIELTKRLFSISSVDILVKTPQPYRINSIKESDAKKITDYVNQCINNK